MTRAELKQRRLDGAAARRAARLAIQADPIAMARLARMSKDSFWDGLTECTAVFLSLCFAMACLYEWIAFLDRMV